MSREICHDRPLLGPVHMEARQPAYRDGGCCRDLTVTSKFVICSYEHAGCPTKRDLIGAILGSKFSSYKHSNPLAETKMSLLRMCGNENHDSQWRTLTQQLPQLYERSQQEVFSVGFELSWNACRNMRDDSRGSYFETWCQNENLPPKCHVTNSIPVTGMSFAILTEGRISSLSGPAHLHMNRPLGRHKSASRQQKPVP